MIYPEFGCMVNNSFFFSCNFNILERVFTICRQCGDFHLTMKQIRNQERLNY